MQFTVLRRPNHGEQVAANPRIHRFYKRENGVGRNRRVDGRTAFGQDLGSRLGRQNLGSRYDAIRGDRHRAALLTASGALRKQRRAQTNERMRNTHIPSLSVWRTLRVCTSWPDSGRPSASLRLIWPGMVDRLEVIGQPL